MRLKILFALIFIVIGGSMGYLKSEQINRTPVDVTCGHVDQVPCYSEIKQELDANDRCWFLSSTCETVQEILINRLRSEVMGNAVIGPSGAGAICYDHSSGQWYWPNHVSGLLYQNNPLWRAECRQKIPELKGLCQS